MIKAQTMNEFDIKAKDWDKNMAHVERSRAIADAMKKKIVFKPGMKALEYGAGTGLLSFMLKDFLEDITLMDSSQEMINVLKDKIREGSVFNMHPEFFDLEKNDFRKGTFDLIYTLMVLHHVDDIKSVLGKFYNLLNPEGILAIADLYQEDGSFHGEGFTGHKGFDPGEMAKMLELVNFRNITFKTSYVMKRTDDSGHSKEYPVFLMIAYK